MSALRDNESLPPKKKRKGTDELLEVLKKYIPNIDLQNPIIKYHFDKLKNKISDISDLLVPVKSIFLINDCKTKFIECLLEIYSLHLKYSEKLDDISKYIEISLSAALSIPQIESYIICLFLLDNDFAIMRLTDFKKDDYEDDGFEDVEIEDVEEDYSEEASGKLSNLTQYLFRTKNAFEIVLSCFLFFSFFFILFS